MNPMFDCPEATHTSPIATSFTVSVFLPEIVISPATPGGNPASCTLHLPAASAAVSTVFAPSFTVTFSPAAAQPQTFAGFPCCKTM